MKVNGDAIGHSKPVSIVSGAGDQRQELGRKHERVFLQIVLAEEAQHPVVRCGRRAFECAY
jgi:hypothetical protein